MKILLNNKFRAVWLGYIFLGLVFFLILTKLWVPSGYVIAGHDSGLPLDAKQFLESRFLAWDDRVDFGNDNSHLFGSITLHSIDYLSSVIAGVSYAGNWANLFIWFSILFLSASVFAYQLKDRLGKYFVFLFPLMVIFNFYLFQSVFMVERAKYSILAATLLLVPILLRVIDKKIPLLLAAIISSMILFFFNGGGLVGLPLYGNILVVIVSIFIFQLIISIRQKSFMVLARFVLFLLLLAVGYFLINAYQILPYLPGLLDKDYLAQITSNAISDSHDWVDYISQNASMVNIFRLQGMPAWYSGAQTVDITNPYAAQYVSSTILIIISFIFPIVAFSSLILTKLNTQKRVILLFALITLVSMFFTAGTHSPLGFIYGFLYTYIPGFSIFRTPYYKFGGAYFISISVLIAFSLSQLIERFLLFVKERNLRLYLQTKYQSLIGGFFCLLLIGFWLGYHYVLLDSTKVFSWKKDAFTKVVIPSYVWDFKRWIESENYDGRILLFPSLDKQSFADSYNWGYWSLSALPYVLTTKNSLSNESSLTDEERAWLGETYRALEENDENRVINLSSRLGVSLILYRRDLAIEHTDLLASNKSMASFKNIEKIKSFGEWDVYKVNHNIQPETIPISSLSLLPSANASLFAILAKDNNHAVIKSNKLTPPAEFLEKFYSSKINVYECQSCMLENISDNINFPPATIFPNSPFYFLKVEKENKLLASSKDVDSKISAYLGFALRRVSETKSMLGLKLPERYINSNLETIINYLNEIEKLTKNDALGTFNYSQAKHILDIVVPMQRDLQQYVNGYQFATLDKDTSGKIYEVLWSLLKLSQISDKALSNIGNLSDTKIYSVAHETSGDYEFYLDPSTSPTDGHGKTLLPKTIEDNKNGKKDLHATESAGLIYLDKLNQRSGSTPLTLNFDLPNLFIPQGNEITPFPTGFHGCYLGKIADFKQNREYEVDVYSDEKFQTLRLFFKEDNIITEDFFNAGQIAEIRPLETSRPFKYVYRPSFKAKNTIIYLCSNDMDFPVVKSIVVHELVSPVLISIKKEQNNNVSLPEVTSQKIDSTRYLVTVKNSNSPFIFMFNERYNSLWKLYRINSESDFNNLYKGMESHFLNKKSAINSSHFSIDGYGNGWVVNDIGNSEWVLEYIPQELFKLGVIVTILSVVLFLGSAFVLLRFKK